MFHNSDMNSNSTRRPNILIIEDNPGDVRLIAEAMKETQLDTHLTIIGDGVEALNYLYKKNEHQQAVTPDLIFLDLNIPKIDGRDVLRIIKHDTHLKQIPVIIFTVSSAEEDVQQCYKLHANCYITKPFDIEKLIQVFNCIHLFWFNIVTLPTRKEKANA